MKWGQIASVLFIFFPFSLSALQPLPDEATVRIETPAYADRQIAKFRLLNGIEVYCVSDPQAEKSAVSLTVQVGSWSDPDEYPGLAHFLEHMLFLGTKKYPEEASYRQFIQQNNGTANAYTAPDHTAYMFSIDTEAFTEALDRFSHFFKDPLFHPSGVAREILAIDQEYAKNIENDAVRQYYVGKVFAHPKHPHRRFTIGNHETLKPVTREMFLQWYSEHYSANLMHVVVYSPLSIAVLKQMTIDAFQPIQNTYRQPVHVDVPLYNAANERVMIFVEPIKKVKRCTLLWELPFSYEDKKVRDALEFYAFLLGHEGKTSLFAYYQKKHWAERLRCGPANPGGNHLLFSVQIDLTNEGVEHLTEVIESLFATFHSMQRASFPSYLVEEYDRMKRYHYIYPEKEDAYQFVSHYGALLLREDLRSFPEKSQLPGPIDESIFFDLFVHLIPEKALFFVLASGQQLDVSMTQKEPWIGVSYATAVIAPEVLQGWAQASIAEVQYPAPNPFIPSAFSLLSRDISWQPLPQVAVLAENEKGKLYYAKDEKFLLPKIYCTFEILSPSFERGNAHHEVLADLFLHLFMENFNPVAYLAKLAGIQMQVERSASGVFFHIWGIREKISLFIDSFFHNLQNFSPTDEQVRLGSDFLLCQYENTLRDLPLRQGMEFLRCILRKSSCSSREKTDVLQRILPKHFRLFVDGLWQKTYVTGIVYGHLQKEQALNIWEKVDSHFSNLPYREEERKGSEIIVFPEQQGPFFCEVKTESQGNATILAIETFPFSFKQRAVQQIFSQAISEPFFSHLRTKQQTAYIVLNRAEDIERHLFTLFAVQSNSHDSRDLLSRFELLLEQFLQEMDYEGFGRKDFVQVRNSLLKELRLPPKSMEETMAWLRSMVYSHHTDFDWVERRRDALEELTYQEFIESARKMFGRENKRRFAVLVNGQVPPLKTLNYQKVYHQKDIRNVSTFTGVKVRS